MPAIINHKICDQANVCGGIDICPVGAFTYNQKTKQLEIDNKKCISCGLCAGTCPIGAIGIAKTEEEYKELKQIIEDDPRSPEDLFVDRYGADIISKNTVITPSQIESKTAKGKVMVEVIDLNEAKCLIKSIPFKEICKATGYNNYYRTEWTDDLAKKYKLTATPSLLLFNNGKLTGIVSGYYEDTNKDKLFAKIK